MTTLYGDQVAIGGLIVYQDSCLARPNGYVGKYLPTVGGRVWGVGGCGLLLCGWVYRRFAWVERVIPNPYYNSGLCGSPAF
jgi:hypothetical protein